MFFWHLCYYTIKSTLFEPKVNFVNVFYPSYLIPPWTLPLSDIIKESESGSKYEPRREKTGFLHMRKQRRRSASR